MKPREKWQQCSTEARRRLRALAWAEGLAALKEVASAAQSKELCSARLSKPFQLENQAHYKHDETHYFATAVIEKNSNGFKLATVSWPKEPLETWLARAEKPSAYRNDSAAGELCLAKNIRWGHLQ